MFNKKKDDGKWYLGILIAAIISLGFVGFTVAGTGTTYFEEQAAEEQAASETDADSEATGDWEEGEEGSGSNLTGAYTPGSYDVEVEGHNGPIALTVEFSETEVVDIAINEHDETEGIGTDGLEGAAETIVEDQNAEAAVVSGSTVSSEAIIEGVEQAAVEASTGAAEEPAEEEVETDADTEASPEWEG